MNTGIKRPLDFSATVEVYCSLWNDRSRVVILKGTWGERAKLGGSHVVRRDSKPPFSTVDLEICQHPISSDDLALIVAQ